MDPLVVLRYAVLLASGAAMVVGGLVMLNILVPRYFPEEYRFIVGLVVFLFGLHRLVVTVGRGKREC